MKKSIILSIFLFTFCNFYAQDYDLIITAKGDSLACHIDSITESHIYFEMKHNNNWIHTAFQKEDVTEYKKDAVNKKLFSFKPGTSYIYTKQKVIVEGYQHAHRLMFAPTSLALKKGDAYYNTNYALIHSLQYGFTDNISLDFGTTIVALPIYAMFNASFPVSNNFAFTVGNLVLFNIGEWQGIIANLTYGLVSIGKPEKNLNIGAGYLYLPDFLFYKTNTAAFTISGQLKIGRNVYLLTENYGTNVYEGFRGYIEYINNEGLIDYESYRYLYKITFIGGMTGIRITGKRNPRLSWQIGAVHIFLIDEDFVPSEYNASELENHLDDGKFKFIPIPIISFSYKFGKNYK